MSNTLCKRKNIFKSVLDPVPTYIFSKNSGKTTSGLRQIRCRSAKRADVSLQKDQRGTNYRRKHTASGYRVVRRFAIPPLGWVSCFPPVVYSDIHHPGTRDQSVETLRLKISLIVFLNSIIVYIC